MRLRQMLHGPANSEERMTSSQIAEEAWKRAAAFLHSDLLARTHEVEEGTDEMAILRHIEKNVIPSLQQRARIIARNRKDRT